MPIICTSFEEEGLTYEYATPETQPCRRCLSVSETESAIVDTGVILTNSRECCSWRRLFVTFCGNLFTTSYNFFLSPHLPLSALWMHLITYINTYVAPQEH